MLVVGWTLAYELFFYTMTAIALAACSRSRIPRLIAVWAIVLLILQLLPTRTPWPKLLTSPLALEFMAGAVAGLHWRRLSARHAWGALTTGLIRMAGACLWLADHPFHGQTDGFRVLAFGLPFALVVAGLVRLEVEARIQPPRIAVRLGDASYSLYLTHVFVLSLSGRIWGSLDATGTNVSNAAFVPSTLAACCAIALLIHRFVKRPVTSMGNRAWRWCSSRLAGNQH